MTSVISYLKARACERSTRLAGLAILAVVAWAAWQWRLEIQHVIACCAATVVAAIPEYAMGSVWRWLSVSPVRNIDSEQLVVSGSQTPLGIYLAQLRAQEPRAATNSSPESPGVTASREIDSMDSLEALKEKIISDLGPSLGEDLVKLIEAEIVAVFTAAVPGRSAMGLVQFAARVIDTMKALSAAAVLAQEPAPPATIGAEPSQ